MAHKYRVLPPREEHPYERWLADLSNDVIGKNLGIRDVRVHFIERDPDGEHVFAGPIYGFCPRSGKEIFIRRGLCDHDLVLAMAHELRHSLQYRTGKYCRDEETRERDARLYELEVNPPKTGPEIRRWLWVEQAFAEDPSLRESFARAEALIRDREPPAQVAAEWRSRPNGSHPTARTSNAERITYIRALLSRLPETQQYCRQRAKLAQELAELAGGVAA